MAITAPEVEALRTCKTCGEEKPLDQFVRNGGNHLHRCKDCRNGARRQSDAARKARGDRITSSSVRARVAERSRRLGLLEIEQAPDPYPAQLLHELLREDRDRWGLDFEEAWADDTAFALSQIRSRPLRQDWAAAFDATRAAWEAAWHRQGPRLSLAPSLLDDDLIAAA
jgi:hypothetical protein